MELPDYPRDWHIHRDHERMVPMVERWAVEIQEEQVGPADAVLFKIGRVYSHGGLVVAWPLIIHAWLPARCVTMGNADSDNGLAGVPRRFFTFKGPW
jgi:hypothetical protein